MEKKKNSRRRANWMVFGCGKGYFRPLLPSLWYGRVENGTICDACRVPHDGECEKTVVCCRNGRWFPQQRGHTTREENHVWNPPRLWTRLDVPLIIDGVNYVKGQHAYLRRLLHMANAKMHGNDVRLHRLEDGLPLVLLLKRVQKKSLMVK
ncbi:hypothetical protein C4B63_88g55 [Trypanosoma cruzi]|uniref:Uncharacterized protein n=1 Tax=Trypanosoma cruzi TaxID=5693 RepID=A0A2V2UWI5_TRYCR|nr:hypothetical protein C4B63_88g55 [Trypanosoma cruzi]